MVNPDGLRNQVEGCIVQTLSRALHEEVKFDRSRVTSVDWASYPILSFPEAPAVEVVLDRPARRAAARSRRGRHGAGGRGARQRRLRRDRRQAAHRAIHTRTCESGAGRGVMMRLRHPATGAVVVLLLVCSSVLWAASPLPDAVRILERDGKFDDAKRLLATLTDADAAKHAALLADVERVETIANDYVAEARYAEAQRALSGLLPTLDPVRDSYLVLRVQRNINRLRRAFGSQPEQDALAMLDRADGLYARGAYTRAKGVYEAVAMQNAEDVGTEVLRRAKRGVAKSQRAAIDAEPLTLYDEALQPVPTALRTLTIWMIWIVGLLTAFVALRALHGQLFTRAGHVVNLVDLTASPELRGAANHELSRALIQTMNRVGRASRARQLCAPPPHQHPHRTNGRPASDCPSSMPPRMLRRCRRSPSPTGNADRPARTDRHQSAPGHGARPGVVQAAVSTHAERNTVRTRRLAHPACGDVRPRTAHGGTMACKRERVCGSGVLPGRRRGAGRRRHVHRQGAHLESGKPAPVRCRPGCTDGCDQRSGLPRARATGVQRALDADRDNWLARFHLAIVFRRLADPGAAIHHLRTLRDRPSDSLRQHLETRPDFAYLVLYQLGSALTQSGGPEEMAEAETCFDSRSN